MRNIRLFWQIFPSTIGITILSIVLVMWAAAAIGHRFYLEHLQRDLFDRAMLIESTISQLSRGEDTLLQDFVRQHGRHGATRITVIDARGRVLADSSEDPHLLKNHGDRPEVQAALQGGTGYELRENQAPGEAMAFVAVPVSLTADNQRGALRLGLAVTPMDTVFSNLWVKIIGIILVMTLLAGLLARAVARHITKPLERMKQGAEQLTRGRIDQLVKIDSGHMPVEMAGLANTINQMADQINRRIRIIIQQRNELEAVFSSMADAVVAIDADKKIIRMNQAAVTLFALSSEEVKGKTVAGVIRNPEILSMVDASLKNNLAREQKVTLFHGAEPLMLDMHVVPLLDDADKSMGVLLVMNDLTKLNRLENIRQDFVANVSHELKTPITAIKGYVETLIDGALEDKDNALRFLKIVVRQANRLDAIVEDLLTLSRIEDRDSRDDIPLTVQEVGPVLESALQTCAVNADDKDIVVEVECDEPLFAPISQQLLEQAVVNLLNNAIAYSPSGSLITLCCQGTRTTQGERLVHISVIDNGPGIAKEHLPRLFERFYRCDKARSRAQGGTGLGLAIVKHIARVHNGTVGVESTPGKGSTFTITLPGVEPPEGFEQEEQEDL